MRIRALIGRAALLALCVLAATTAAQARVVISQVYGGGGNSGAPFTQDFVELFNTGSAPQSLDGWSIQYSSSAGSTWGNQKLVLPSVTLQPGQYFLVGFASGSNGVALPAVDAFLNVNMSATAGKVLLASTTTNQTAACPDGAEIVDLVPFGTAANCSPRTAAPSNSTAVIRGDEGCADTNDVSVDFSTGTPLPRNSASPLNSCVSAPAKLVISQVYGGGGGTSATFTHDFVELFNSGGSPASLDGLSIQSGSAAGTGSIGQSANQRFSLPNATVLPGQYFLVQLAGGSTGVALPVTPDAPAPATNPINLAQASGKIVLVTGVDGLGCNGVTGSTPPPNLICDAAQLERIVDLVGFGTTNFYEGTGPTALINTTSSAARNGAGCDDTDNNVADFTVITPPAPRNSATALNVCSSIVIPNPVLSIADAQVAEGDSGQTPLAFTVSLSAPAPAGGVDLTASTADGTAIGGTDYVALTDAPFSIAEGQSSGQVIVQVIGNTVAEPAKTFTVTIDVVTADVDLGTATATGTILNDDPIPAEIYEIQGVGLRSPYAPATGNVVGELVRTEGNVVTALSINAATGLSNGFFIQTPDARAGNAPAQASTGLYVFTGGVPSVQVGDLVEVTGFVQEYFDWTQLTGPLTIAVTSSDNTLPTPVVLDETRPSPNINALSCPLTQSNFECFENMRVSVAAGAAVTGNQTFGSDQFAEPFVTASGVRARREKGLLPSVTSPLPGLPVWDGNPEVFELDADGAGAVPVGTQIFGGDVFEAVGVISYQFGNYALRPTELFLAQAERPRPVPPTEGEGELRVGSLNVLNMCSGSCSPRLDRIAGYIGEVLLLPDVIGLQEVFTDAGLTTLATTLNITYGTDYVGYAGIANTTGSPAASGIRNAFLVKSSRVTVSQVRSLDAAARLLGDDCSGGSPCVLHDRPPLLLEGVFAGERFAVMNNHTRSLIGITEEPSNGLRVRNKRFEQGKAVAGLVQRFQQGLNLESDPPTATDTADVPLFLVGDYNAFEVSDGYADVVGVIAGTYDNSENQFKLDVDGDGETVNITNPPLRNLVLAVNEEDRYSYTYAEDLGLVLGENTRLVGSIQVIDHGLANAVAEAWCPELVYGRANADAPDRFRNNGTTLVGSSDHDGFVIRLRPDRNGVCEPTADIQVEVTAPVGPLDVNSTAGFQVVVSNLGVDAALAGTVSLQIDIAAPAASVTVLRDGQNLFTCDAPVVVTAQTSRVACDLTSALPNGDFETFGLDIIVPVALANQSLEVSATATVTLADPDADNNSDEDSVAINARAAQIFADGFEAD